MSIPRNLSIIADTLNSDGTFASISNTGSTTLSSGTANGVAYLNGSKILTSGSAFVFDGTNVGIGTSSPVVKLHVATSGNTPIIGETTGGATSYLNLRNTGGQAYIAASTNDLLFALTAGATEGMRLTSTGLGIGTSSPAYKLDMTVTAANNAGMRIYNSTVGTGNGCGISFSVANGFSSTNQHAAIQALSEASGNTLTSLAFYTSGGSNTGNATERMRIDSSGNVGIGTSSASRKLEVSGTPSTVGGNATGVLVSVINTGVAYNASPTSAISLWNKFNNAGSTFPSAVLQAGKENATDGNYAGYMSFITVDSVGSPTERMRLDSSGNLLVGKTSANDTVVGATLYANGVVTAARASSSSGDASFYLYSTTAAAARFYVDMAGTIHATSIVITAISDQRLKENVRDIDTGLDSIMALKPRRFDWKEGKGQDKKNAAGFIAQEFGEVFPASLSTFKAGGDGVEYLSMNHEELIPSLVKAIQEQQALITSLTARITALESKEIS